MAPRLQKIINGLHRQRVLLQRQIREVYYIDRRRLRYRNGEEDVQSRPQQPLPAALALPLPPLARGRLALRGRDAVKHFTSSTDLVPRPRRRPLPDRPLRPQLHPAARRPRPRRRAKARHDDSRPACERGCRPSLRGDSRPPRRSRAPSAQSICRWSSTTGTAPGPSCWRWASSTTAARRQLRVNPDGFASFALHGAGVPAPRRRCRSSMSSTTAAETSRRRRTPADVLPRHGPGRCGRPALPRAGSRRLLGTRRYGLLRENQRRLRPTAAFGALGMTITGRKRLQRRSCWWPSATGEGPPGRRHRHRSVECERRRTRNRRLPYKASEPLHAQRAIGIDQVLARPQGRPMEARGEQERGRAEGLTRAPTGRPRSPRPPRLRTLSAR